MIPQCIRENNHINLDGDPWLTELEIFASGHHGSLLRDVDFIPKYQATGTENFITANRISYFFGLHDPSVSLDTAFSSAIVALDHSAKALQRGESSMDTMWRESTPLPGYVRRTLITQVPLSR